VVRVFNDRGACLAGESTTACAPVWRYQSALGSIACPSQNDSLEKHGNPNVLTLDKGTSKLTRGVAHIPLVEVELFKVTCHA
jgi:biotin/methionine sulfoxide reductase